MASPRFEPLKVSLRLHWRLGLALAGVSLVAAALAAWATPRAWRVDAELLVNEPVAIHRLANPFAPVPSQKEELDQLPELLTSRTRVVALVKRSNLLDQWDASRPLPLQWKDRLQRALFGPPADKDRLEALVAMLERRLQVTVKNARVRIGVEWPDPEVALRIAQTTVASLQEQRETREVRALTEQALALDEQLAGIRTELRSRVERIDAERTQATASDADREQLSRDRTRAAELLVKAEEKHITAEVMRRANALRFIPLRPPALPREAQGPTRAQAFGAALLSALLAALVGTLALGVLGRRLLSGAELTRVAGLKVVAAVSPHGPAPYRSPGAVPLLGALGLALATGVALGTSRGVLVVGLLPVLLALAGYALWKAPPRYPLLGLILLSVTLDDPNDRPYAGLWQSPLYPLGKIFYTNVVWFTGFELCVAGLAALWALKTWFRTGQGSTVKVPMPLKVAVWVSFASVVWLIVLGLARGGIFREALWQFRAMLMLPPLVALAFWAFEFPRDLGALLKVLAIGSVVKSFLGIFFVYVIITTAGQAPPHTTGHNDTMILVTAAVVCLLLLWEKPTQRHLLLAVIWLPLLFLAIKLNDRRIAYIDLFFAMAFVYVSSPWHRVKRALSKAVVLLAVPALLYTAAGWNVRYGGFFSPVQKLRSIVDPEEDTQAGASSLERDIENYNILRTWERNPLLGQGFGHAFSEFKASFDFRQSNYGHIGHNSVLWLWWIAGPFAFTGILAYLVVGIYLLRRSLLVCTRWRDRVALFTALSVVITYLVQAFGDMGFAGFQFTFFIAAALSIAGQLATRLGVLKAPVIPAAEAVKVTSPVGSEVAPAS